MKRAFLVFCLSCFFVIPAFLSAQAEIEPALIKMGLSSEFLDSLMGGKGGEPTLQEILDSLGYDIDVENDKLPTEIWEVISGQYSEVMLAEVAGYSDQTASGWYVAGSPDDTTVIFTGESVPPDTAYFYITGCDSNGLFIAPFAGGGKCDYVYYTEPDLNPDQLDHAWVFCSKKRPNEFVIAWEDVINGGDFDYNDLVLVYQMPNRTPVLEVPDDTSFFLCEPETICFDNISAYDLDYCGDTVVISKVQGPGTYDAGTCCFLPASVDSVYEFVFVATDWFGAADTDTVVITVDITKPVCSITGDSVVCDGFTTQFCATAGMAGYSWSGPGGFSANTQCTGQIGTAGYYEVIITDANGCADTCGRTLVVYDQPVCEITGDSLVCEGSTTQFCATAGMSGYSWSGPGGFSANTECTGQIGVAGYYEVIITDVNGCADTCGRTLVV